MNEATRAKSSSKEEKVNQLWQGIKELKETMLKLTIHFTSIYRITALLIFHFIPRAKDFY